MHREELFNAGNECRNRSFHVRRTACIQHTIAHGWGEWLGRPLFNRSCRHNIGVPCKYEGFRCLCCTCAHRPQIGHAKIIRPADDVGALKAQRLKARFEQGLTARVIGGVRAQFEQFAGEIKSGHHIFLFRVIVGLLSRFYFFGCQIASLRADSPRSNPAGCALYTARLDCFPSIKSFEGRNDGVFSRGQQFL